jgi:hypothetical protein
MDHGKINLLCSKNPLDKRGRLEYNLEQIGERSPVTNDSEPTEKREHDEQSPSENA